MPAQLFLIAPSDADAATFVPQLKRVLEAAVVDALLLPRGNRAEGAYKSFVKAVVPVAQPAGAAVLIEGDRAIELGGSKGPLRLAYACAFDDSNCGEGDDTLFRPDRLGRRTPQGSVTFEETTIVSMLRRSLQNLPIDHVLRSGRLVLPTEGAAGPANPYSSCHLPEIIEQFYADLVEVA